jgi:hypothetical protein
MTSHEMVDDILICRRLAGRLLGLRLGFYVRCNTIKKMANDVCDTDFDKHFMCGLEHSKKLNDMKIMGALIHPLYQSKKRMIDAGLCTEDQYRYGIEELMDRLSQHYARQTSAEAANTIEPTHKYDKVRLDGRSTPLKQAQEEYDLYTDYMVHAYLPVMKPSLVLGAYTEDGDLRDVPLYQIGAVVKRGKNLPSKFNHANYVDDKGHYNLVQYLEDHRAIFPGIYEVGIGQLCPHITTEVDCESLFSEAGFVAEPRRASTNNRLYERLVITKHRLGRIYCDIELVKELYMKRWRNNDWDEKEERDAAEFLEIEKEIHLKLFPNSTSLFDGEDEEGEADVYLNNDEDENDVEVVEVKKSTRKGKGKRKSEISEEEVEELGDKAHIMC